MVQCPILMLVVRGPTYFGVRFFVGLSVVFLPPLTLILRTAAVLRTIGDPNHDVFRFRRELRNRWEVTDVARAL